MRKYILVYLFLGIMLLIHGCSNEKNKDMSTLTGELLWSASYGTGSTMIYGSNLNNSLSELKLYYSNDNYRRIFFPSKTENSMLYVGINDKGENEIFKVVNGVTNSLLKKQDDILFPVALENHSIIYIGVDKAKKTYLGQFLLEKNNDKVLKNGNINTDSRPSISSNGSILFVEEKDGAYSINLTDSNSNAREIINGRYPVWLEDDNKFIYYYDRSMRLYDLSTNKTQVIEKGLVIKTTPVISPDKKFMAIFQSDTVAFFGGETVDYLRIMPTSGGKKVNVSAFYKTRSTDSWGGLEWIE